LKSERDTLEKGFLPIPAFSSVAAVGRTAAKPMQNLAVGRTGEKPEQNLSVRPERFKP
jgi:hypothetical protein